MLTPLGAISRQRQRRDLLTGGRFLEGHCQSSACPDRGAMLIKVLDVLEAVLALIGADTIPIGAAPRTTSSSIAAYPKSAN